MHQRLDATQRFYEALRLQFVIGAADLERLYAWSRRLLEVEREVLGDRPAFERNLARMKRVGMDLGARPRTVTATAGDREAVEFFTIEATLWDAGARGDTVPIADWDQRIALAKARFEAAATAFQGGETSIEAPYLWSARWQQSERDRFVKRDLPLLEQHLQRILRVEATARTRAQKRLSRPLEPPAAEFFRWEAEYYVLMNRDAGLKDERRRKAFTDAWGDAAVNVWEAALGEFRARQLDVEAVHLWSLRRFDAERVRGPDSSACEAHLARLQRLERELRSREDYGLGLALGAMECFRLDAEERVARARSSA